jgi:hypothetical protein
MNAGRYAKPQAYVRVGLTRKNRGVHSAMLFIVIEHFRDLERMAQRFKSKGRMLPDGLTYLASWIEPTGVRCFQLMETDNEEQLHTWISRWDDLVDFEINPVLTSADFWAKQQTG